MNRVGDMGLSIGFFAIFALFGSLDYATVFSLAPFMNETAITIIGLLIFTGAMAKSAQIPLHSWLPGSMEGLKKYIVFYLNLNLNLKNFNISLCNFIFLALSLILAMFILTSLFYLESLNSVYQVLSKEASFRVSGYARFAGFVPHEHIFLMNAPILNVNNIPRDKKGRFTGTRQTYVALSPLVKDSLIGDLLGDGHLRFNKKGSDFLPRPNSNAQFAMTLKSEDYVMYLWQEIYASICSKTPPHPWPNPKTGKPISQYHFASRSLISLSEIHKQWYVFNEDTKKFIKIVPLNIGDLLTPRGLAHWIMGDGYWDSNAKTVKICTDNFTEKEVELLIKVLNDNFELLAAKQRRIKANKEVCWRIKVSGKFSNISKLRILVKPYLIPSMYYKLNTVSAD
jgi:hypothetical protein